MLGSSPLIFVGTQRSNNIALDYTNKTRTATTMILPRTISKKPRIVGWCLRSASFISCFFEHHGNRVDLKIVMKSRNHLDVLLLSWEPLWNLLNGPWFPKTLHIIKLPVSSFWWCKSTHSTVVVGPFDDVSGGEGWNYQPSDTRYPDMAMDGFFEGHPGWSPCFFHPFLVGGLEHFSFSHVLGNIGKNHPNWLSYFSEG